MVGRASEDLREDKCQLEAWHITVALDGVDALAGYTRGLRELLLGPSAGGAKLFDSVHDGWHTVKLTFQNQSSAESNGMSSWLSIPFLRMSEERIRHIPLPFEEVIKDVLKVKPPGKPRGKMKA